MTYSDEDLIAFHNGVLETAKTDALVQDLETDCQLERRLMALDPAAQMVKDSFALISPQPVDLSPKTAASPYWMSLAVAASTVAAAVMFWTVLPPSGPAWHHQVSAYQVLYTPETISMIAPTQDGLAEQFATLDTALAIDFGAGSFADIAGLDLLRAQLLGFEGAPLGQIVFADTLGRPIALCLMAGGADPSLAQAELSGLNTVSWGSQTHQFILVGAVPADELQAWAEALRAEV